MLMVINANLGTHYTRLFTFTQYISNHIQTNVSIKGAFFILQYLEKKKRPIVSFQLIKFCNDYVQGWKLFAKLKFW